MKYIRPIFYLLSTTLLLFSTQCKTSKPFQPKNTSEKMISYGFGGGVTGRTTTYYLNNDSYIYMAQADNEIPVRLGQMDKSATKQTFNTVENYVKNNPAFSDPGNLYYFLKYTKDNSTTNYIWSSSTEGNHIVKSVYQNLINTTKKIKDNAPKSATR